MMGRLMKRGVLLTALTLLGCAPSVTLPATTPTTAQVVLRLYTTSSAAPLAYDLTAGYRQVAPHVQFEIVIGDHAGLFDRVQTREAVLPAYLLTHHLPPDAPDAPPVWAAPVAQDAIAVIVAGEEGSPAPPGLDQAALRSIFQGWVDRWGDAGGGDAPIRVIVRDSASALAAEFDALVMGSRQVTRTAQVVPSGTAMLEQVTQTPGAVGYASFGALDAAGGGNVRALEIDGVPPTRQQIASGAYPLRSFIYFTGAGEPETDYRAFIGWAQSPAGQSVAGRHYLPVNTLP